MAQLFLDELTKLASAPVEDTELSARKSALIGPYVRGLATTGGLSSTYGALASLRLPLTEAGAYVQRVQSARPPDVQAGLHRIPV